MHGDARVELAEHGVDPGGAADDRGLAGDHAGVGQAVAGDQLRGDVAAADVLGQSPADVRLDLGAQFGKGQVGHGGLHD
ncbi:hypothetical protein FQZ97_633110 [compost metagenome]